MKPLSPVLLALALSGCIQSQAAPAHIVDTAPHEETADDLNRREVARLADNRPSSLGNLHDERGGPGDECGRCIRSGHADCHPQCIGTTAAVTPTTPAGTEVKLATIGKMHALMAEVDGIPMPFLLDTGASMSQITVAMAKKLIDRGLLVVRRDIREPAVFVNADGSKTQEFVLHLSSITVGNRTVYDIDASLVSNKSIPLLGQDFLRHFGSYTIDNNRGVLVLPP